MASGDWIAIPIEFVARATRPLVRGDYTAFEVSMLFTGLGFVAWLINIRRGLLTYEQSATERIARYSFGAFIVGLSIWCLLLAYYMSGAD